MCQHIHDSIGFLFLLSNSVYDPLFFFIEKKLICMKYLHACHCFRIYVFQQIFNLNQVTKMNRSILISALCIVLRKPFAFLFLYVKLSMISDFSFYDKTHVQFPIYKATLSASNGIKHFFSAIVEIFVFI